VRSRFWAQVCCNEYIGKKMAARTINPGSHFDAVFDLGAVKDYE
jgi:hypothetical protein